ncbi:unnamed protein product [Mytilus coruscus]|uniref:Uncharacterized protein n=1 Tax=Mytilus coruscus TaxID=42192 RepID=A0A6J8A7T2_MYTCO|nr:unnamed protein product [Mytilus coruscus]
MELRNVNIEDFCGEFATNIMDENASGHGFMFLWKMERFKTFSKLNESNNCIDEKPIKQGQGVESSLADHEIDILIKVTENKNTNKATKWAVNVYEDWKNSKIEKVNSVFDSLSSRMDNLEKKFEDVLSEEIADAVQKVVHEEFGKEISNFKKEINQDIDNMKSDLDKLSKSDFILPMS